MAREQNISGVFLGEDKTLRWTITQADNVTPQDITNWDLEWVVRYKEGRGNDYVIDIVNGPDLQITDGPNGVIDIALSRARTLYLAPGAYAYSLWRTDSGYEEVLAYGNLELDDPSQNQTPAV